MNRLLHILFRLTAVMFGSFVLALNSSHGSGAFDVDNGDTISHSIFADNTNYVIGHHGPSQKDLNHKLVGILTHPFYTGPSYRSSVFHLGDKNAVNIANKARVYSTSAASLKHLRYNMDDKDKWVDKSNREAGYTNITVSPEGEVSTLQQAIQQADSGAIITIQPGTYKEHNVNINKSVTIRGSDNGKVIIDGEQKGFVLKVTANHVTIQNLEVHNSKMSFTEDYAGILLDEVRHVTVENVKLVNNFFGIYLAKSAQSVIRNNTIVASATRETTSGNGIHLWYCKNITVENNHVEGHRDGIYFEFVEDSHIEGNISEHNLRYGLHFMFSDRCVYTNNTFSENSAGVAVMYTERVTMTHNTFIANWGGASYGLLLKEISDSKIINNQFINNTTAIHSEASNRVAIDHNNIQNNGAGLRIMANSVDVSVTANNFTGNTFDVTTNSRQNYSMLQGNYWSEYEGYDLNRDGLGDVPYRPVSMFALLVERHPQALVLLRSLIVELLNTAERVMPALTPESLVDKQPSMERIQ